MLTDMLPNIGRKVMEREYLEEEAKEHEAKSKVLEEES